MASSHQHTFTSPPKNQQNIIKNKTTHAPPLIFSSALPHKHLVFMTTDDLSSITSVLEAAPVLFLTTFTHQSALLTDQWPQFPKVGSQAEALVPLCLKLSDDICCFWSCVDLYHQHYLHYLSVLGTSDAYKCDCCYGSCDCEVAWVFVKEMCFYFNNLVYI